MPRRPGNVHLPRRGQGSSHLPGLTVIPKGPAAAINDETRAASRPAATRKARRRHTRARPSLAVQRLAAGLALRLPWIATAHIGSLCHLLTTLGLDHNGWTAQDVLDLLETRNRRLGLYSIPPGGQRDPLALFAHELRDALSDRDTTEPPRHRRERETARHQERQAALAAETAALRAANTARHHDTDAQARITAAKASARAGIAAAKARTRERRTATDLAEPAPPGPARGIGVSEDGA
jgi:hypothetical protein